MKRLALSYCAHALFSGAALAEVAPAPDPTLQALAQMVGEGQQRELTAWTQVYALRAQIEELKTQLSREIKRADEAEARAKVNGQP